ncbi:hypothetical protein [Methanofollis fontis]|uniref:hypothetical protein n=1 Tax=Methanofollis fontis TaxID=2052832 RepID=UPI0013EEB531|nr:hypothetical protein [Methanofollis fontis]
MGRTDRKWPLGSMTSSTLDDKNVENKLSVLKRKFSGDLKARKFLIQTKDIAGKIIVCNLHRSLQFLIVEVFYSAFLSGSAPPQSHISERCKNWE